MDIGVKEIRRWHKNKGWADIGYHAVIRRNGTIELGRPWHVKGAHARGHNHNTIGICLIGGIDAYKRPVANFTAAQEQSLALLVAGLKTVYKVNKVIGHNDLTDRKACPSFNVAQWLEGQTIQSEALTA